MKSTFELDLDASKFTQGIQELGGLLNKIGENNGVVNLIESVETLATGFLALKAIGLVKDMVELGIEAVVTAEHINTINKEFENLAESAGLVPKQLEEGLRKAADGLVDDTTLIKAANQALIAMGSNAQKLPDLFNIARKAASAFGGEAIDRFNEINQAIETGNTRGLRQIGLVINSEDVYKRYARSIGVTVDRLSEEGKQHALLNEVLEQTNKKYKDVDENANKYQNSITRMKVAFEEMQESAAKAFYKIVDGTIHANEKLGEMINKAKAAVHGQVYFKNEGDVSEHLKVGPLKRDEEHDKSKDLKAIDPEEQLKAKTKYYDELAKLRLENAQSEMASATSITQWEDARSEELEQMDNKYYAEKSAKEQELKTNSLLTKAEKDSIIEQMEETHMQKMAQIEGSYEQDRIKAIDDIQARNDAAQKGFSGGWNKASHEASKGWNDFKNIGGIAFKSVSKNAEDAFVAMGDGTKTASEAMRGFMFGALADIAAAEGRLLLAEGLAGNPAAFAGGAALLALSGFLRSMAKGPTVMSGGGDVGGGGGSYSDTSDQSSNKPETKEAAKKTVTLQVMGNIYETEETKQRLVELIRQNTDATDFKYQQIGVS